MLAETVTSERSSVLVNGPRSDCLGQTSEHKLGAGLEKVRIC